MKENNEITEAQLLLNQQIVVTSHMSRFTGRTGIVNKIMADGRTLDVTLVGEIQESTQQAKTEQSLGPIANHLVKDTV